MSYRWRLVLSFIVLVCGIALVLPSLPGTEALRGVLPDKQISLGLDLKGGIHLTLGVDVDTAIANELSKAGQDLRALASDEKIVILRTRTTPDGRYLEFLLPKAEDKNKMLELIAKRYSVLDVQEPVANAGGGLIFRASFLPAERSRLEAMTLDQAVRTIRNRIDQFGVAEPDIRKQADNRIQIQLPGMDDSKRAIQLVGQTAQLVFRIVRDDVDPKGSLPTDVIVLPLQEGEGGETALALGRDVLLTGEDITDARPQFDENGKAYVSISFNTRGAAAFDRITTENVNKRMAIVLDGVIYSAPVIRERIAGGRASISGSFTTHQAQDLAIALRAGSLPAPVKVMEERTVGPSLGRESIESGIMAAVVGALAVVIIMPLYYGLSGLIADIMLCFTMTLLMAGMAAFGATMTLPGIAGIVLTIGMAVDANVLIFERIREEIRNGYSPLDAIHAGFSRASISITDSNLTTIIAAAILYYFGTGPIRGFAVTLTLGIIASMFTAIFVSRAVFVWWMHATGGKRLSI